MRRSEFELFADYYQFYLQDESAEGNLGESWDDDAVEQLLAIAPGTIGVGTVRNMDVPVTVEIHDKKPDLDIELWDHLNECSLDVPTGQIVIAGCTDYFPEAARIQVVPGTYRARISYGNLDTLSDVGLDGNDKYRIQLWAGTSIEPRTIKKRPNKSL